MRSRSHSARNSYTAPRDLTEPSRFPNRLRHDSRWQTEGVCHGPRYSGADGLYRRRGSPACPASERCCADATAVSDCGRARRGLAGRGGYDRWHGSSDAAGLGDPVQRAGSGRSHQYLVPPFVFLAKLSAHEQKLLAGMAEHETVIGAQICKALPFVARHAAEDGALAVHDLVMGERQDKIFGERVVQAEQDLTVMMLAVDRIPADVFERVVHPSHIPLVAESQPAPVNGLRYHRPGRRFLRRRGRVGKAREQFRIEAPKQADRFKVFSAAIFVWDPAALRAAVIEVEHRSDGVDAQPVDAISVGPEQAIGEEEIGDFGTRVIITERVPVEMAALHRIGMFVNCRAVELTEPVRIVREMPGHPIENDSQAGAMASVHQAGKVGRRAESAGGSEQAGWLVAPGSVERLLADRQEFDVGEAEITRIGRQFLCQLAVAQPPTAFLRPATPRAEMYFIN